ncbi:hypothetical protein J5N97_027905 [Dioscorea zingiberensis]|uniref:Receptor-like kinase n=1 Tax=Dioscorea zingiberensis TaxID=325984 RepID=A0A9D5BY19_9LILI|nr:hypothetical protein J5N97_027905 [Dioscorea zingiberensis]
MRTSGHNIYKLIAGLAAALLVILTVVALIFVYVSKKADRERALRVKVEMFLASYKTTKPTRFTYPGIKKITKRFKKNIDPLAENLDEIYFPEWIYEQLIGGESFRLAIEMMSNEEETVRKLVIVALWCIQWSPIDRPTMSRVVQMLIGTLELEVPPRPFVSTSSDQENGTPLIEV